MIMYPIDFGALIISISCSYVNLSGYLSASKIIATLPNMMIEIPLTSYCQINTSFSQKIDSKTPVTIEVAFVADNTTSGTYASSIMCRREQVDIKINPSHHFHCRNALRLFFLSLLSWP